MSVIICGLGPGDPALLTYGAVEKMKSCRTFLRTANHGAVKALADFGVVFESFDALYDHCEDFDALCLSIAQTVGEAARSQQVVYAVPSGGGFADATVQALYAFCKEQDIPLTFLPGVGYIEQAALGVGSLDGAVAVSAQQFTQSWVNTKVPLVLCEVDSRLLACDLKVLLLDFYPQEHLIYAIDGALPQRFALSQLDRQKTYSHRYTIVVPPVDILALSRYDFSRLLDIGAILRGRNERFEGCPWDMEQTHLSMRPSMIEEAYEAAQAIDDDNPDALADELGDVLLQVVLHAQVAKEYDEFDIFDVVTKVCQKMIRRHPHVFGEASAETAEQVLAAWEQIKTTETPENTLAQTLYAVPKALPALLRAEKVLRKAHGAVQLPQAQLPVQQTAQAIGDLLLALTAQARDAGISAEEALHQAVNRLIDSAQRA